MNENLSTDRADYLENRCRVFDENYQRIRERFYEAVIKSSRPEDAVTLSAASKTVEPEVLNHAYARGLRVMGENRVQELLEKLPTLEQGIEMQFIGRLQTNKVKYIVDKVSLIQSVDSVRLAAEINKQCHKRGIVCPVLVEVNIGEEENKGGILPEQTWDFIDEIRAFPAITVKGLMTIGPADSEDSQKFAYFEKMQKLFVDIGGKNVDNISMDILSMGMSGDFETAILAGSNFVRIGSALFGNRIYH